jgi:co-chaperonin GroES (HSP10)
VGREGYNVRSFTDASRALFQAEVGDYALFFRRAAAEITFEGKTYLVVPQAAILTLVREEFEDLEG